MTLIRQAARAGFHAARVNKLTSKNRGDVRLLRLGVEGSGAALDPFTFKPGQWVDYYVPECDSVGGFSIISSPGDLPNIDLAVKFTPNSKAATFIHKSQREGDLVFVRSGGDVHWDPVSEPMFSLQIAGGIGVTPFLSMCSSLHKNHAEANKSRIALIHSFRAPGSCDGECRFPAQELSTFKSSNHNMISVEELSTDGEGGGRICNEPIERALDYLKVERELLEGVSPEEHRHYVKPWVCGPEGFVSTTTKILVAEFGFLQDDIKIEKWW